MSRYLLLTSILALATCQWAGLTSDERSAKMLSAQTKEYGTKCETVNSYLQQKDTTNYYPSFIELVQFLSLFDNLKESSMQHCEITFPKGETANELIYRLFRVPINEETAHTLVNLLRKPSIRSLLDSINLGKLPMSFLAVLELGCGNYRNTFLCESADKYISLLTNNAYSRWDVVKMLQSIIHNEFALTTEAKHLLIDFPAVYGMYIGRDTVLEHLLKKPLKASSLLAMSPLSIFPLRRVDKNVFCDKTLFDMTFTPLPNMAILKREWAALPPSCFEGSGSLNNAVVHEIYDNYEFNERAILHKRTTNLTHNSNIPLDKKLEPFYGQVLPTLTRMATTLGFDNFTQICALYESTDFMSSYYWDPISNTKSFIIDMWGSYHTKHCNKDYMWHALLKYVNGMKTQPELPTPAGALEMLTNPITEKKDEDAYFYISPLTRNLHQTITRYHIIDKARRNVTPLSTEFIKEIIKQAGPSSLFSSSFISFNAFANLVDFYPDIMLSLLTEAGVYRGNMFKTFFAVARPVVIEQVLKNERFLKLILAEKSQEHGMYALLNALREAEDVRQGINEEISAIEKKTVTYQSSSNFYADSRQAYRIADTRKMPPYHVTLLHAISLMSQGSHGGKGFIVTRDSPETGFLECFDSIARKAMGGEVFDKQMSYLRNFKASPAYTTALIRNGVCDYQNSSPPQQQHQIHSYNTPMKRNSDLNRRNSYQEVEADKQEYQQRAIRSMGELPYKGGASSDESLIGSRISLEDRFIDSRTSLDGSLEGSRQSLGEVSFGKKASFDQKRSATGQSFADEAMVSRRSNANSPVGSRQSLHEDSFVRSGSFSSSRHGSWVSTNEQSLEEQLEVEASDTSLPRFGGGDSIAKKLKMENSFLKTGKHNPKVNEENSMRSIKSLKGMSHMNFNDEMMLRV